MKIYLKIGLAVLIIAIGALAYFTRDFERLWEEDYKNSKAPERSARLNEVLE